MFCILSVIISKAGIIFSRGKKKSYLAEFICVNKWFPHHLLWNIKILKYFLCYDHQGFSAFGSHLRQLVKLAVAISYFPPWKFFCVEQSPGRLFQGPGGLSAQFGDRQPQHSQPRAAGLELPWAVLQCDSLWGPAFSKSTFPQVGTALGKHLVLMSFMWLRTEGILILRWTRCLSSGMTVPVLVLIIKTEVRLRFQLEPWLAATTFWKCAFFCFL